MTRRTGRSRRSCGGRIAAGVCASTALALLVVGPPWALVRLVGSPLPRQAPSPAELLAVLTRPPDSALVLAVLAGVCWLAWAAFVLDVLLAAVAAVAAVADLATARRGACRGRGNPALPRTARWRPGAALVGIVLLAVVGGYRPTPAAGPLPVGLEQPLAPPHTAAQTAAHGGWVDVRGPTGGVHDSLWRIADRELGDPTRWPELFERNAGRTQPDGRALTTPELIQPGWRLALPTDPPLHDPPRSAPRADPPAGSSDRNAGSSDRDAGSSDRDAGPVAPDLAQPNPTWPEVDARGGWLDVGPGVVLGIGFATVVAGLLVAAHRRRGNRRAATTAADEFPVLPVVREIARRATPRPAPEPDEQPHVDLTGHAPPEPRTAQHRPDRAGGPDRPGSRPADPTHPWTPPLTVARSGNGLGLAGPGAQPALRALLLELLVAPGGGPPVIVGDLPAQLGLPVDDLVALGAHLAGTVDEAAAAVASLIDTEDDSPGVSAPVVLAAAPPDDSDGSIAALLAGGAVPVLLGSWAGGATAYVRTDGTIAAAGPTAHADLVACRLPVLDLVAATELIELSTRARVGQRAEPPEPPVRSDDERHTAAPPRTGTDLDPGGTRPTRVWTLAVLGRPSLHVHPPDGVPTEVDVVSTLTPRMLCLLVFLALHPHGVRRDTAVAALWPDTGRGRPGNNLSSLISRLRSALRSAHPSAADAQLVLVDGDRYRLDPDHVWVDYWDFLTAGDPPPRQENDGRGLAALRAAHDLYRGPLGEGIDDEWILSVREAARRSFLAITAQLVRAHVDTDPAEARRILETVRNLEPTNQAIYRDIIALQLKSGDNSGAAATMRLLESQLADLDEVPDDSTRILAQQIEHGPTDEPRMSAPPHGAPSQPRASLAAAAPGQPPRADRG